MTPFVGNLPNFTPTRLPYNSYGGSIFKPSPVAYTNLVWALATGDVTAKSTTSGAEIKSLPNVVLMVVMALLPKDFTNDSLSLPRNDVMADTLCKKANFCDEHHTSSQMQHDHALLPSWPLVSSDVWQGIDHFTKTATSRVFDDKDVFRKVSKLEVANQPGGAAKLLTPDEAADARYAAT